MGYAISAHRLYTKYRSLPSFTKLDGQLHSLGVCHFVGTTFNSIPTVD